jgi:hypothetical protein
MACELRAVRSSLIALKRPILTPALLEFWERSGHQVGSITTARSRKPPTFCAGTVRSIKVRQIDRDLISRPVGICPLHDRWKWFGRSCNGENNLMSREHYIYDFSAGVVRDLDYLCDLESIASDIEEGAMGFNGDELWSKRNARIKSVMGRLNEWVDERFSTMRASTS